MDFYKYGKNFYDYCGQHYLCSEKCKYYYETTKYHTSKDCYIRTILDKYYMIDLNTLDCMDTDTINQFMRQECDKKRATCSGPCTLCYINTLNECEYILKREKE